MMDNLGEASASSYFLKKSTQRGDYSSALFYFTIVANDSVRDREVVYMAADWAAIKLEYITTDITLRKLAEKHKVPESTIFKKSANEQWEAARKKQESRVEANILKKEANRKADRAARLSDAADLLLSRIEHGIATSPIVTPTAAKNYSDALKNIREIHMIRTEEDIEEQKARIAKLNREAEKSDTNSKVTVIIEGDGSYGE